MIIRFIRYVGIFTACCFLLLAGLTHWLGYQTRQAFPPIGDFSTVNGAQLHYVDQMPVEAISNVPVIFIHGASGNLRDQMFSFAKPMQAAGIRSIYVDRPGQGYSESFEGSNDPKAQANSIAKLMDQLGIEKAVIAGHSFGGVITGAFGVLYPENTAGLVFLAPVTHSWETGVNWRHDLGNTPVFGWIMANTVAVPVGTLIFEGLVGSVFEPNAVPDGYAEQSAVRLGVQAHTFLENSQDVARVIDHIRPFQSRYTEITAPTLIFHGNKDTITSPEIHSINGLAKDIPHAKLTILEGVGHKPDYVARDEIVGAIKEIIAAN